jgi:hypothetical protein
VKCAERCGREARGLPCPMCVRRLCGPVCLDEHAVKHLVAHGMLEENARQAMVGDVDSPEEQEALRREEERTTGN